MKAGKRQRYVIATDMKHFVFGVQEGGISPLSLTAARRMARALKPDCDSITIYRLVPVRTAARK